MLFTLIGYGTILVTFSAALPLWNSRRGTTFYIRHDIFRLDKNHSKRRSANDEVLEPWIPNGVPGHIDLISTGLRNQTVTSHQYNPYAFIQSIPNAPISYKIGEIGYNKPSIFVSLDAMPFGRGTKFWILKSHDVDCYAGSEFASSYNATSQIGGTEYPVTLRSPLGADKGGGPFAYCATYDPNPQGTGMTLGAAPCATISCAPLPPGGAKSLPNTLSRNPDGTLAPKYFTTRPCNYLDPNCHVSQMFLFNAKTGVVRPMYHTGGMQGVDRTWISSGQPRRRLDGPQPLVRSVEMVFRQGDTRALPGWPDPDPSLVVAEPGFDMHNSSQVSASNITSPTNQLDLSQQAYSTDFSVSLGLATSSLSAFKEDTSMLAISMPSHAPASQGTSMPIIYPVWLVPPVRRLH